MSSIHFLSNVFAEERTMDKVLSRMKEVKPMDTTSTICKIWQFDKRESRLA